MGKRGEGRETATSLYLLFNSLWKSWKGKFYAYCCVNSENKPTSYSWNKSPQLHSFSNKNVTHASDLSFCLFNACRNHSPTRGKLIFRLPSLSLRQLRESHQNIARENTKPHYIWSIHSLAHPRTLTDHFIAHWNKQRHWGWPCNNLQFHSLQKKLTTRISI